MNLLVDIGNSRCKWAVQGGRGLQALQGVNYTTETLSKLLDVHWRRWGTAPDAVWVSNVAGMQVEGQVRQWVAAYWGCELRFAHTQAQACGVMNGYDNPQQLGVDRWLAMLAARQLSLDKACLVADCGTAVTLDVLDQRGVHQGGWIVPGLQMMRSALQQNAHALQQIQQSNPLKPLKKGFLPARDTQNGVLFGTLSAVVCLITQVWDSLSMNGKLPITVFLTGGAAPEVYPHLSMVCQHEPDLVLRGLAHWAGGSA
jgi:type III pantothenate kinase